MRVLFLFPRPLDSQTSIGGVAEFLSAIVPILQDLNVVPIIYAGFKNLKQIELADDKLLDAKVYNGPFLKPRWFISYRLIKNVISLCQKENIDIIHAQGTYLAGFMALQIYKQSGIPYVVTSHGDILPAASKRMKRFSVQKRCISVLKYAKKVTHLTPMLEKVSHQLFNTTEKSVIISNGVNTNQWQKYSAEKNFLLAIGRLELGKGFHIIIETYQELVKNGFTVPLVIAGTGTKEFFLHQLVQKLGLNLITNNHGVTEFPEKSVIFTGYVRGETKSRLIENAKLILFATQPNLWEEAYGIVQLEAMAAGRALVASDTTITRYLQTKGLQCLLVSPTSIQEWMRAILTLLNDDTLRKGMGEANKKAAISFDWHPIVKQYVNIYRDVTAIPAVRVG